MIELKKRINSKEDFNSFCKLLAERVENNEPISDNPMLDGITIAFIVTTGFAYNLFTDEHMGQVLDGTIQKLENILLWLMDNESKLCQIIDSNK
jgi:hypothetical protein